MHRCFWSLVAVLTLLATSPAFASNAACWGDDTRTDITCVPITEVLLEKLQPRATMSA